MSSDEIRKQVYAVYEAINAADIDRIDQLFAPDIIRHAMGEIGIEAGKRAVQQFKDTAGTRQFVVQDVIVEGNKAALRVEVQDTNDDKVVAPFPVIMEIFRFEDGKVAEIWGAGSTPKPMQPALVM